MITLEQCYSNYHGQALLVPGGDKGNDGQCVQWADTVYHEVYGLPYIYTPAALDWWTKADALGITKFFDRIAVGQPIEKGDFVIYDERVGAPEGHIDVASREGRFGDFWAYDSNWGGAAFKNQSGFPVLHEVHHADNYNNFIVGYLRWKGAAMTNDGDVVNFYDKLLGRKPEPEEIAIWTNRPFKDVIYGIVGSDEYNQRLAHIADGPTGIANIRGDELNKLGAALGIGDIVDANGFDKLLTSTQQLSTQNKDLQAKLDAVTNNPDKIIITSKGFKALWEALKSFANKNQ